MIRIVVLFFLLMMSILVQGQSSTVFRKGKVVDAKQEELAFVTVLLKDEEGRVVTSFYTDDKGEYQVDSKENFSVIEFQYVGFQSQAFPLTEGLPAIVHLVEDNALLEEVVITAKRPTIKREIDRLVFNVQDTPLATTNAWDIVKQTPGVNAIGDNLSIRGSQSILVTINDKKVMLSGDQLKSLLEGTDGTQVEAIEVITNPPAKYEAQGNAVLNIKLKKNNLFGYKGSIGERFKQTTYAYNTLSTQHTYTGEKINVSGSYSFGNGTGVRYNEDNVFYENGERWSSVMTRKNNIKGQHSFQAEMDIKVDTTLTLIFGGNGYINEKSKEIMRFLPQFITQRI
ncbi:carboxypeptidase-like regulatory domain-containing protein [Myroides sp. mNGS23_01]|nr:carboxypeptidase-like regulatory domain-containing protein [Myroides sp. mNGS23_01]WHT38010.1 carboxypeptidase-like regulatory domain-containing protein [Myroides sp. mNGS23_01]